VPPYIYTPYIYDSIKILQSEYDLWIVFLLYARLMLVRFEIRYK
jgi:hypothetical protein